MLAPLSLATIFVLLTAPLEFRSELRFGGPIIPTLRILPVSVSRSQPSDYTSSRNLAASEISSGRYTDALNTLNGLLKVHRLDPSLWTLRGIALNGLGQTIRSLASFDRALFINSGFVPALEGALQTSYLRNDMSARHYARKLLAIEPENEVANAMAGALSYQDHDCISSIKHFERSKDEVFRSPTALSEYGDCLLREKRVTETIRVLTLGAQLHPESVQLKYNLALAELQDHQPNEAISILVPMSNLRDSELLNLLATAYAQANLPDDALRSLENAIAIDPENEGNYIDLGLLCLDHDHEACAVDTSTRGISKRPRAASLFLVRGIAYTQLGEYDKAEADFTAAAQIEPEKPHSIIAMSLLDSRQGQVDKAQQLLKKQLVATPNDAITNYMMADLLARSGVHPGQPDFKEAEACLITSLRADPASAEAHVLMADLLATKEEFSGALDHIEAALRLVPENRAALNRKIILLRRLHRIGEIGPVVDQLKVAISRDLTQDNPEAHMRVHFQALENPK